eukprot:TRINITY_DN61424_c0_g1_i1.p1 TRINITY_DN61424_c0_g1~~TRINITY_DN61424_c0_g1_i1.p1  ORF type:complete len:513 (-),score=82.67 TRINITY_DN61424_c0_g1_i1:166-1704(-)
MAKASDFYEAYYLCRLAEVTDKKSSLPRLTTAQEKLRKHISRSATDSDLSTPQTAAIESQVVAAAGKRASLAPDKFHHRTSSLAILSSTSSRRATKILTGSRGQGLSSTMRSKIHQWSGKVSLPPLKVDTKPTREEMKGEEEDEEKEKENIDDDLNRKPTFEETRALQILQESRFFKDLAPALLAPVPRLCSFAQEPKDSALFRAGDQPTNCYIIVSGCVGFYIGGDLKTPRKSVTEGNEDLKVPPDRKSRVYTKEKWSTFSASSSFGRCVKKAKAGEVFGELALMDDTTLRGASAKCLDDSELLCVPTEAFAAVRQSVREAEAKKRRLLAEAVPGMKDQRPSGAKAGDPAANFYPKTIDEGTVLLRQGRVENNVIYVVVKGAIKLTNTFQRDRSNEAEEETICTLERGECFGSLPHSAKEPFTAVAATKSEILVVQAPAIFSLPEEVLQGVRAKISADTAKRLRRRFVSKQMGWDQQTAYRSSREDVTADWLKLPSRELRLELLRTWQGPM